ncbi:ATP-binding protein [Streptomyces platensis]|uniref:ATP-binding protein n=1 Tax=Streptomyces platensis TaxID=58346 RepID=UPI0037B11E36
MSASKEHEYREAGEMSDTVNTALRVDDSALDALRREGCRASPPVQRAPAQPWRAVAHAGRTAPRAVLAVPSHEPFVRACRDFATQVLSRWGVSGTARDSAVLVIDELAVNAVQHGHADTTVALSRVGDILLISVADSGATVPRSRDDTDSDEHGRGLAIIEFLAEWTEVDHTTAGRRVRAGLRL